MEKNVAVETYGKMKRRVYRRLVNSNTIHMIQLDNARLDSVRSFFCTVFLPHGYPESVSEDYLEYQIWDSVQAFASAIIGGIATYAVLKGVGVGDESSTALAATITWVMKDGISMVGRITFSWFQGTKFDSDCKKWRFFADLVNDVALFLDLISAHFKGYFFFIVICLSGLLKSIVGVAGSATRAALTQHQARNNNLADVSAKDGSQETLVNLAALVCNLILIPNIVHNQTLVWSLYIVMTIVHLIANLIALGCVNIETFNRTRFQMCVGRHLQSRVTIHSSVRGVNKKESVLFRFREEVEIHLGVSFSDAIQSKSTDEIDDLILLYKKSGYFLTFMKEPSGDKNIYICLRTASAQVQLEAMYQAHIIVNMYHSNYSGAQSFIWDKYTQSEFYKNGAQHSVERFSKKFTEKNLSTFKKSSENRGWNTNTVMFNADVWHVDW